MTNATPTAMNVKFDSVGHYLVSQNRNSTRSCRAEPTTIRAETPITYNKYQELEQTSVI
jgi:hypothetical protein